MKSTFSYKVVVDHDKKEVYAEEFINGKKKKLPLYIGCSASSYDVAQACRVIAYFILERADEIQHNKEFVYESDIKEQIEMMLYENKSPFQV